MFSCEKEGNELIVISRATNNLFIRMIIVLVYLIRVIRTNSFNS